MSSPVVDEEDPDGWDDHAAHPDDELMDTVHSDSFYTPESGDRVRSAPARLLYMAVVRRLDDRERGRW